MGSTLLSTLIIALTKLDRHEILRNFCHESVRKGLKQPLTPTLSPQAGRGSDAANPLAPRAGKGRGPRQREGEGQAQAVSYRTNAPGAGQYSRQSPQPVHFSSCTS